MRNASKENYRPVHGEPMSQGTRCRQLAEYVVFFSPLNMLSDSPSNYLRERESLEFIAGVPTVWDETVPLAGAVGEQVAVARRGRRVVCGRPDELGEPRHGTRPLVPRRGPVDGREFQRRSERSPRSPRLPPRKAALDPSGRLKVHLAPGGGFAARISR